MISRCYICGDIAPDGSTVCDSCCFIEVNDNPDYVPESKEREEE